MGGLQVGSSVAFIEGHLMNVDQVFGGLIVKVILIMVAFLMAIVAKQQVQSYLIRATSHTRAFAEFAGSLVGVVLFVLIFFGLVVPVRFSSKHG
jgi:hypothetical protein